MEQLKVAMARIIINVIQADGIIDDRELDCMERMLDEMKRIKAELKITNKDFYETRNMAFCEALNILKEKYKAEKKAIDRFIELINELAKTDNVVSSNEAMLLLAINYVVLNGFDAFSTRCGSVYFSKQEVIFLDSEEHGNIESSDFDGFKNTFQAYGFHFIYVPDIIKSLFSEGDERMDKIISFLYPHLDSQSVVQVQERLAGMNTYQFCNVIADILNYPREKFKYSILFKITNSEIYDKKADRYITKDDFVMFRLEGNFDKQLVTLFHEYRDLVGVINNNTTVFPDYYFNSHGFHRTLLDAVVNRKSQNLTIDLTQNPQYQRVTFDNAQPISMGDKYLCIYLLIIYMSKDSGAKKDAETYQLFKQLCKSQRITNIVDFLSFKTKLTHDVREIREAYIGEVPNLVNKEMFQPICKNGTYFVHKNTCTHVSVTHNSKKRGRVSESITDFFENEVKKTKI